MLFKYYIGHFFVFNFVELLIAVYEIGRPRNWMNNYNHNPFNQHAYKRDLKNSQQASTCIKSDKAIINTAKEFFT